MTPDPFRTARVCACGDHGFVGLTRGAVALVSPDDVPKLTGIKWCVATVTGGYRYAVGAIAGSRYMHRLLAEPAPGQVVDHINGDTLDNRAGNRRCCSAAENGRNRRRVKQNGFKGVHFWLNGYSARIFAHGKMHLLGRFKCPVEAARAYDAAAIRLHGEFAKTNADLGLLPASTPREASA